jgi:hypothetical protein
VVIFHNPAPAWWFQVLTVVGFMASIYRQVK